MARKTSGQGERLVFDHQELSGVDLSGRRLGHLGAIGSRLRSCLFRDVRVDDAVLGSGPQSSEYVDCVFDGARIAHASGRARFVRCSFRDVDLRDWDSTAFEMIDCTFTGRLRKSIFYGRLDGVYAMTTGPRSNDFHGNDFSDADLQGVEFRWGVDLSQQRLPAGPDYVYLPDLVTSIARARAVVNGWSADARRRRAEIRLEGVEREVSLGQTQMLLRISEWVREDVDAEVVDVLRDV